jgi:hypothetical protein
VTRRATRRTWSSLLVIGDGLTLRSLRWATRWAECGTGGLDMGGVSIRLVAMRKIVGPDTYPDPATLLWPRTADSTDGSKLVCGLHGWQPGPLDPERVVNPDGDSLNLKTGGTRTGRPVVGLAGYRVRSPAGPWEISGRLQLGDTTGKDRQPPNARPAFPVSREAYEVGRILGE